MKIRSFVLPLVIAAAEPDSPFQPIIGDAPR
jgi:hypothetical protein